VNGQYMILYEQKRGHRNTLNVSSAYRWHKEQSWKTLKGELIFQ